MGARGDSFGMDVAVRALGPNRPHPDEDKDRKLTSWIARSESVQRLLRTCQQNLGVLNHIHVSAALSKTVELGGLHLPEQSAYLGCVLERFIHVLDRATVREVSNVLWALAKLGVAAPDSLLRGVLMQPQALSGAQPRSLANILWALGTWGTSGPDGLLQLLLELSSKQLPSFNPQDTSNVLWALARLGPDTHAGIHTPASHAPSIAADPAVSAFIPSLIRRALDQADALAPPGLAMAVWACKRLQRRDGDFLRAASRSFLRQLDSAAPGSMVLMLHSLAGLRWCDRQLFRAAARRCNRGLLSGLDRVQQLKLLWAYASVELSPGPEVLRDMVQLLAWPEGTGEWEPGGRGGVGTGGRSSSVWDGDTLSASTFVWGLGNLVGEQPESGCEGGTDEGMTGQDRSSRQYEQPDLDVARRAALDAAAAILRNTLGPAGQGTPLGHLASAAWGLEHMGLGAREEAALVLQQAAARLRDALDAVPRSPAGVDGATAGAGEQALAAAPAALAGRRAVSPAGGAPWQPLPVSQGDLESAVMVLWCMGRQAKGIVGGKRSGEEEGEEGPVVAPEASASLGTAAGASEVFAAVLAGFIRLAPSLVPYLSAQQLPLVCRAFVQLGCSDPRLFGAVVELLLSPVGEGRGAGSTAKRRGAGSGTEDPATSVPVNRADRMDVYDNEGWVVEVVRKTPAGTHSAAAATALAPGGGAARRSTLPPDAAQLFMSRLPRNSLAITLWALASAGYTPPELLTRAASVVAQQFPWPPPSSQQQQQQATSPAVADRAEDQPQHLWLPNSAGVTSKGPRWAALLLWSFAAANAYSPALYDGLLGHVVYGAQGPKGQRQGQRTHRGRRRVQGPGAQEAVQVPELPPGAAAGRMGRLSPDLLSMALWACAVAGHYRREPLERLCAALQAGLGAQSPASLAQGMWAVSHLTAGLCLQWRGPDAALLASRPLSQHQAAVLLWSLAVQQLPLQDDLQRLTAAIAVLLRRLGGRGDAPCSRANGHRSGKEVEEVEGEGGDEGGGALDPGVGLIAAEALALLLASPQADLRTWLEGALPRYLPPSVLQQMRALWARAMRRRHPLQGDLAVAARAACGLRPRLLRTHRWFPLGLAGGVALREARPRPAVLLLADPGDFCTNVRGQPLGALFTQVQLLQERGWAVAVVPSQHLGPLRWSARRARYVRQLLAAAGVELPAGAAAESQGQAKTFNEAQLVDPYRAELGEGQGRVRGQRDAGGGY